jgi:hypothetical protein
MEEFVNAPSFTSKRDQDGEKMVVERARNRPEVLRAPQPGMPTPQFGTN